MSSIRSSATGTLAAFVAATAIAASFASGASAAEQKPTAAACKAARLSAWFEHQRQLDVDNNPFFVLPAPKECEMDGAQQRADNRDTTESQVVASQAAAPSQPATQVR
jgi:hypothetical protein